MSTPKSPYQDLPPEAYWRSAVAGRAPLDPGAIYTPRFPINRKMRIMTAGSCFAQHVGRALRGAGFNVLDTEPLPDWIPASTANRFGYGLYSARYGNVYTARQMQQLLDEAYGDVTPALPVWTMGTRFVDAQRPNVEPEGLTSEDAVMAHRADHLAAVRAAAEQADLFVFTFGLTEAWVHKDSGTIYPTAPGTIAGTFDPDVFAFDNAKVNEVIRAFGNIRKRLMGLNPKMKFLVTVSPVPLTATASGQHVEVATARSKAVLRAAAAMVVEKFGNVDYFPSYEIITSQAARGTYYAPNLRSVTDQGVATAMATFLAAHGAKPGTAPAKPAPAEAPDDDAAAADAVCEEALLDAFAK